MFTKIKQNKILFLTITIVGIFGIAFFITILFSESRATSDTQVKSSSTNAATTSPTNEIFNYNFSVVLINNEKIASILSSQSESNQNNETNTTDSEPIQSVNVLNSERQYVNRIVVDKLGVDVPIITGTDGESAIHSGIWYYPSSYDGAGEKIFLGHRRYWGQSHPYSFWKLDQLEAGDKISYYDGSGNLTVYKVTSSSIKNGNDTSILNPSKQEILKLISCSTADGSAGSSEKRIVVVAEKTTRA